MTYEEMHAIAQYLYQLLDDIDTATDMAKSDDKLYRAIVERTQAKKALIVDDCDGYTVTFKPMPNVDYPDSGEWDMGGVADAIRNNTGDLK